MNVYIVQWNLVVQESLVVSDIAGLIGAVADIGDFPVTEGNQIFYCFFRGGEAIAEYLIILKINRVAVDS